MQMTGKEAVEIVHERLRSLFGERPRGTLKRILEAREWPMSTFMAWRRRKTIRLQDLVDLLNDLGADPGGFLATIFGTGERQPRKQGSREGPQLAVEELLCAAEERRYVNTFGALSLLQEVRQVEPDIVGVSRYHQVAGSTFRMLGLFGRAKEHLLLASEVADTDFDLARTFRRLAIVEVNNGCLDRALELLASALTLHQDFRTEIEIERAVCLSLSGDLERAAALVKEVNPAHLGLRYVITREHMLLRYFADQGKAGPPAVRRLLGMTVGADPYTTAQVFWTAAKIDKTESRFRRAIRLLGSGHIGLTIEVAADYCQAFPDRAAFVLREIRGLCEGQPVLEVLLEEWYSLQVSGIQISQAHLRRAWTHWRDVQARRIIL